MGRSKGEYLCGKNAVPMSKIYARQYTSSCLPKWERWSYIIIWILAVVYLGYSVYKTTNEFQEDLDNYHMSRGWSIFERQKDSYDFEWDFWASYLQKYWYLLLGHVIVGQLCRLISVKTSRLLKYIYIGYAFWALTIILGVRVLVLLITHTVITFLCAYFQSILLVGVVSILLVSTLNSTVLVTIMKEYLILHDEADTRLYYLMMFVTAMCNLRYTSFAMEKCWDGKKKAKYAKWNTSNEKEALSSETSNTEHLYKQISQQRECVDSVPIAPKKTVLSATETITVDNQSPEVKFKNSPRSRNRRKRKEDSEEKEVTRKSEETKLGVSAPAESVIQYTFVDALFYVFYFPLFCTGPLLTYDKFLLQWNSCWHPWSWSTIKPILLAFLRVIWWAVFCEVILHFMYFCSLMGDEQILSQVPLWSLAGIGFCQGQFFMVKYVVMFGLPACIASLDQIVAPKGPRCIAAIYLYSDMWKYFDRGLYDFIKRYIYVPLGGSHLGVMRQLFASCCSFTFIFVWHGAEADLFVWSLLNFLGITIEAIGCFLVNTQIFQNYATSYLGPAMSQRIKAASAVPLVSMSIIAIFTFFRGTRVGYIYYKRLILQGWPVPVLTVYFVLYCFVHTSIEIDRWRKNKVKDDYKSE